MSLPQTYKAYILPAKGEKPKLTTVPLQKPGQNQILVRMEFAPINPSDGMTMESKYPVGVKPPHGVGLEGCGVVAAVGDNLSVPYKVGDKVLVIGVGTWAEYLTTPSQMCRKVKEGLDMKDAASHFINPFTAHYMADIVMKGGHKAAIHTAGSSMLGRMMIRYFKLKGIKLINIVRREEVIEELQKEGGELFLNSTSPDFEKNLQQLAEKQSATICFDAVGEDMSGKVLRNMPDNSTIYIYGALSSEKANGFYVYDFLFKGKTATGLWVQNYLDELQKTNQFDKVSKEIDDLYQTVFKTKILKVFPLNEVEQAREFNAKNSSKGKTVIQLN